MDRITSGLLSDFSKEFDISECREPERFECFATYLVVRKYYSEAVFDPADLVVGDGGDTGIDAIGIIVNNCLISDVDEVQELLDLNGFLDATFVFVQTETSNHFTASKIGQFGYGVRDFFGEGTLARNGKVEAAAELMAAIFERSGKFKKGNPSCHLYYVTTGKWLKDRDLEARASSEVEYLKNTNMFKLVDFTPIGADDLQKLFYQSKNAIQREFDFPQRAVIQDIPDVKEAHLGYMIATDYLKLVSDESGDIIKSLFYENVRDWAGYNQINGEIRETLSGGMKDRFVLMNNGVTIIAKSLQTTGHKFLMGDFQIVNGCQTSHVLRDNSSLLADGVRIPVRIICTSNEAVMESIITATNRQTEVTADQFFAFKPFAKKLEVYFKTFDGEHRLYYERRSNQYGSQDVAKNRIISHQNLVRAAGAMFLGEPHRTTKNYRALAEQVGKNFFLDTDCLEPYYVSAYAAFRFDCLVKAGKKLDASHKPGKYHILLASRLLMDASILPRWNSSAMKSACDKMMAELQRSGDDLLVEAAGILDKVADGNWNRDHIRTQPITDGIFSHFGVPLKHRGEKKGMTVTRKKATKATRLKKK